MGRSKNYSNSPKQGVRVEKSASPPNKLKGGNIKGNIENYGPISAYSLYDGKTDNAQLLEKFESFNEFNQDFKSMDTPQVVSFFEEIFEVTLMSDTVIIIRDIPSKKNPDYNELMGVIASLIEKIHKIFNDFIMENVEF